MNQNPSCAGRSILEILWEDLLATIRDGRRKEALGLARAIATITNPYNPNIEAVRSQAARRLKESNK